jgi:hypothetical protein
VRSKQQRAEQLAESAIRLEIGTDVVLARLAQVVPDKHAGSFSADEPGRTSSLAMRWGTGSATLRCASANSPASVGGWLAMGARYQGASGRPCGRHRAPPGCQLASLQSYDFAAQAVRNEVAHDRRSVA